MSHSSQDSDFADLLAGAIELYLGNAVRVFVSSRPDDISAGRKWREELTEGLKISDAFVALITPASSESEWIPWEAGYFEGHKGSKTLYVLSSKSVALPSPLKEFQSKDISDESSLHAFFSALSYDFKIRPVAEPSVNRLVAAALRLGSKPPERSIEYFFNLVDHAKWDSYGLNEARTYVCQDDVLFQIRVRNFGKYERLKEPWARGFAKARVKQSSVEAMIAGQVVYRYDFVSIMSMVDGRQYFLPIPRMRAADGKELRTEYVWIRNSPEFRLLNVVGSYFNYRTFDDLANDMGMLVVDSLGDRV